MRSQMLQPSKLCSTELLQRARRALLSNLAESDEHKHKAAEWTLQTATPEMIFEALKKMQAMKGRFYSEVAEKLYGQGLDEEQLTHVERSICEMMREKRMTNADLAEWYRLVIETAFDGDRFNPLPNYTNCVQLVYEAKAQTHRLRAKALDLIEPVTLFQHTAQDKAVEESKSLPELFKILLKKLGDEES